MGGALLRGWLERQPGRTLCRGRTGGWRSAGDGLAPRNRCLHRQRRFRPDFDPAVAVLAVKPQIMLKYCRTIVDTRVPARFFFRSRPARASHFSHAIWARTRNWFAPCPTPRPRSDAASASRAPTGGSIRQGRDAADALLAAVGEVRLDRGRTLARCGDRTFGKRSRVCLLVDRGDDQGRYGRGLARRSVGQARPRHRWRALENWRAYRLNPPPRCAKQSQARRHHAGPPSMC